MAKDKTTAGAVPAETQGATEAPDTTLRLYLLKPWTTGTGHTYPVHVDGEPPLEFDFSALPEGVDAASIDYLISTQAAESAAMRAARLKAEKK